MLTSTCSQHLSNLNNVNCSDEMLTRSSLKRSLYPDISNSLWLSIAETDTQQGNVRTAGDCKKTHLHQVVICQETPTQKRTRSGPNQVNLIAESQKMIVEQRGKPSSFIEGQESAMTVYCSR